MFRGDPADLALVQATQREMGGRQLDLAQLVQEVALVLAPVHRAQQAETVSVVVDAGVVAGGDGIRPQFPRRVEEILELDLAVAQHVRVGRAAGGVFVEEMAEHPVPVLLREVAEADRNAERPADRHRVAAIVLGAAFPGSVVGPVLHEQSGDFIARIAQQQRGDRRVDAAGYADDDAAPAVVHGSCRTSDNGWRLPPR